MWEWLGHLQGAQSSVAGSFAGSVVGIVALVLGALFNFWLNRKRDALLRVEDADAVAAALYGEIILIRRELARTANLVARIQMREGQFNKHFLELIRLQDPMLFRSLASKLGLLPPQLILAITEFYANLELVRAWLPHLVESDDRKFNYSSLSVLDPAISAVEDIGPTLEALARKMNVKPPTDGLDLKAAHSIAEDERELFSTH